ncbi:Pr6Pr family membrane protein [Cellulosimicrobium terreum]|nr:Pr6Pr family membrane protein [Cellulosimicrobium terreum]
MELVIAITGGPGTAPTHAERVVRLFSYFTIQSNVLVGLVAVLLAVDPRRDGRVFRVARLDALLCIAVTGIVYNTVLRGIQDLSAAGQVSNLLLHVLSPLLAVAAWGLVGPRPRVSPATVWWSVAYPLAWIAYTFVRGAVVGWYPYPFLDVAAIGLGRAVVNTVVVAVVFVALAWLVRAVDRRLPATP